jgi:putative transposase
MPRPRRVTTGGLVYHTLNRATGRQAIFSTDGDCAAFVRIMVEAYAHIPVEMLAYCIMPTHWHMVLRPHNDGDLSEFMQWVQNTHSHRWKAAHDAMGLGHLYQGRFKSFPVESDGHFLTVCRYVERNALRAGLVQKAEDWRWGSLWLRVNPSAPLLDRVPLANWPVDCARDWVAHVNEAQSDAEIEAMRLCVRRGRPYGTTKWTARTVRDLGLESSLRPLGRPRRDSLDT